jgi:exodeoxyribonuclease VII large subunit
MAAALKRQMQSARRHLQVLSQSNCLQSPEAYLHLRSDALQTSANRLAAAQSKLLHLHKQRFISHAAKLDAMSPLKVIARGYAIAQTAEGALLQSVHQVKAGDTVTVSLRDGKVETTVSQVKEIGYESAE